MPGRLVLIIVLTTLGLLAAACGGGGESSSPTPVPTATLAATPGPGTPTPTAGGTAGPTVSPVDSGTPRPTAPSGAIAVAPADQAAFLARFAGTTIDYADCVFDPGTSATNCGDNGSYRIDPVPRGQDVSCRVGLVAGAPVLINCTTQEPAQSIYYEIKG